MQSSLNWLTKPHCNVCYYLVVAFTLDRIRLSSGLLYNVVDWRWICNRGGVYANAQSLLGSRSGQAPPNVNQLQTLTYCGVKAGGRSRGF